MAHKVEPHGDTARCRAKEAHANDHFLLQRGLGVPVEAHTATGRDGGREGGREGGSKGGDREEGEGGWEGKISSKWWTA